MADITVDDVTDVVVDLETLATGPQPAVIEFGAVAFRARLPERQKPHPDRRDMLRSYLWNWDREPQCLKNTQSAKFTFHTFVEPDASRLVSLSTLEFWANYASTFRAILHEMDAVRRTQHYIPNLQVAVHQFGEWLRSFPKLERVWSHGAAFDLAIILTAHVEQEEYNPHLREFRLNAFDYRMARDTRTLFEEASRKGRFLRDIAEDEHRALPDAIVTARNIIRACELLDEPVVRPAADPVVVQTPDFITVTIGNRTYTVPMSAYTEVTPEEVDGTSHDE